MMLNRAALMLMLNDFYDKRAPEISIRYRLSGAIAFRCVVDPQDTQPGPGKIWCQRKIESSSSLQHRKFRFSELVFLSGSEFFYFASVGCLEPAARKESPGGQERSRGGAQRLDSRPSVGLQKPSPKHCPGGGTEHLPAFQSWELSFPCTSLSNLFRWQQRIFHSLPDRSIGQARVSL